MAQMAWYHLFGPTKDLDWMIEKTKLRPSIWPKAGFEILMLGTWNFDGKSPSHGTWASNQDQEIFPSIHRWFRDQHHQASNPSSIRPARLDAFDLILALFDALGFLFLGISAPLQPGMASIPFHPESMDWDGLAGNIYRKTSLFLCFFFVL